MISKYLSKELCFVQNNVLCFIVTILQINIDYTTKTTLFIYRLNLINILYTFQTNFKHELFTYIKYRFFFVIYTLNYSYVFQNRKIDACIYANYNKLYR